MLCLRLPVVTFADDEHRRLLYDLSRRCQEATNSFWQQWELWHVQNGSAHEIRQFLAALAKWRTENAATKPKLPKRTPKTMRLHAASLVKWHKDLARGIENPAPPAPGADANLLPAVHEYARQIAAHAETKPRLNLLAVPSELSRLIYHKMSAEFPDLNSRTRVLLQNKLTKLVLEMKSAYGSLSGWMSILLCQQGRPSSTPPLPLPFDKANTKVSLGADGEVHMRVRVDRFTEPGETGGKSTEIDVVIETRGRIARYAAPLHQVAAGLAPLAGSSIQYDHREKKWFVLVSYQEPAIEQPQLNPGKVCFLRPARRHPWSLRIDGHTRWVGGSGSHITHRRAAVIAGRWSRQENYRTATKNRKGHGRERALCNVLKLEKSWRGFCKTYNETVVAEILQRVADNHAGKLLLLCPERARFLDTAGKNPRRREESSWPWYQFRAFLRRKCQRIGIELVEAKEVVEIKQETR